MCECALELMRCNCMAFLERIAADIIGQNKIFNIHICANGEWLIFPTAARGSEREPKTRIGELNGPKNSQTDMY